MLESLPPNDRELLQSLLRRRRYRRGEVVFHQGDPGDTLHIVRRGYLKVVVPSEAGGEGVLAVVGPGALFGEITLLDGAPRSATVVALEDVETATLGRAAFRDLLRRSPDVAESLLAAMAGTIRRLTAEVTDLMFLDLRARLVHKLLELAEGHGVRLPDGAVEIRVQLTQEELAGMIGATRPRVNTLLGFFEDQGVVGRSGRHLVLVKPDRLRYWAGGG